MAASSPGVRRAHPSPINVHHQCHQSLSTSTTPSVKCTNLVLFRNCGADNPQAGWCGGRSSSCQTVVCKLGVVP
ncbi:unnamed protein product [Gadus morhua 'NCC']